MDESQQPESQKPITNGGWLSRERALALVLVVATALAFYVCYRITLPFLPAVTWALALAVVAHPLHKLIAGRVKNPNVAAGLTVGVVAILIVTPAAFLVQQIVSQASRGAQTLRAQAES